MYHVAQRFGSTETRIEQFNKESEAILFIMQKLQEAKLYKLNAVYCLYEGMDLVREYSQEDLVENPVEEESSSSQKGSEKSFRPTPFSTTPKLGPQSWIRGDDDNKDEEDK